MSARRPTSRPFRAPAQWATPVKPIAELARHWTDFLERMKTWLGPLDVAVIGGGAGGVELALAIDHRLRAVAKGAQVQVTLVTKDEILTGQAAAARRRMRAIFQRRGLRLLEKAATVRIERGAVQLESGKWLHADAVFVVTEASAAPWFADDRPAARSNAASSPSTTRCARPATSGSSPWATARRC